MANHNFNNQNQRDPLRRSQLLDLLEDLDRLDGPLLAPIATQSMAQLAPKNADRWAGNE